MTSADKIALGDFVIASKDASGCVTDPWAYGRFGGRSAYPSETRYLVVDEEGNKIGLGNGYRRVKKVSQERFLWFIDHIPLFEDSGRTIWSWLRLPMTKPKRHGMKLRARKQ